MTREEAIEIIESNCSCSGSKLREACAMFIPELKENEDEKIRKWLINYFNNINEEVDEEDRRKIVTYLEKQEDASKAIEVVDRIDKYIDEHVINAHDMKDSNPDKKYYRGWDDALAEMSGILQDVYSGEKQEEQKSFSKTEETELNSLAFLEQMGYTCIPPEKEQKPAEWSEEDNNITEQIILDYEGEISHLSDSAIDEQVKPIYQKRIDWLKLLPERFALLALPIKHTVTIKDATKFGKLEYERGVKDGIQSEKSRQWKPSEEQLDTLKTVYEYFSTSNPTNVKMSDTLRRLYNDIKKLRSL